MKDNEERITDALESIAETLMKLTKKTMTIISDPGDEVDHIRTTIPDDIDNIH